MDILCNNIDCDGIGMRRADWDNFRECQDIVLNGQVIWENAVLSSAVKSQIYEDIVTTGHHSASLALEVWRAANLYCKSHAASHPDLTAQGKLLSAFVNADKDMYCSLPLALTPEAQSAMPTRWLVNGVSGQYFDLGIVPSRDAYSLDIRFKILSNTIIGNQDNDIMIYRNSIYVFGGAKASPVTLMNGNPHRIQVEVTSGSASVNVDGQTVTYSGNMNPSPTVNLFTNYWRGKRDDFGTGSIDYAKLNDHRFIPSKISNTIELLDLETLTLATRVGTFTEQKTIPNS